MRWMASLVALSLAACGFDSGGLPAGKVVRDDTTADFSAAGSTLDQTEIAGGLISPIAYTTGALLAKGANSELFTDPLTIDWTTLDANTAARVALAAPIGDFGGGAPVGVGVAQADDFTLWLAGEIWLEAGTHTFGLGADDNGLLELAPAGGAFTRVVTAQWTQAEQTGTFAAPTDGWYPIHLAMSEGIGGASYLLRHQPPDATMLAPIDPDRFRIATGARRGLVADAFDDFDLLRPVGRSLLAAPMLDQDFGATTPVDSGITAATTFSFHWSAQFRIDVGGDYALTLDTDDGHRLRIDGTVVADHLVNVAQTSTTDPIHLDPGWHDAVIDYVQSAAAAHAKLRVASGPDLAGGPFPIDRVRPVVPRGDRVAGAVDSSAIAFPASGSASFTDVPPIPAGAIVDGIDVSYTVSVPHMRDLQISVIAPDGSRAIVRPQNDVDHGGTTGERRSTHLLDGKGAPGTWKIEIADLGGVSAGAAKGGVITVHYVGGHAPIPTAAAYESVIRDLGAVSQVDSVAYAAATPAGTAVAVRMRTGLDLDALMAQTWSDPVVSGQPPIVAPGQFVQYRVELSSDGDHSPALDWIELIYRAAQ